ncbi:MULTISPECIES: LptF/LptG family permease [Desertifilum]|nr:MULTISPECIES: LptF/LptG family permease [Desertifilum]MDA0211153.1 LptF/LptG family permease [Cyanobacteria bacterium FC1]
MTFSSSKTKPKSFYWPIPRISVMDRYIATEFISPFLFGVGAFSSVGVAIGALFELMREVTDGLPISIAIKVFFLQLPYFISLAFPMSVLLAALLAYGRLSSDSELIALRSCGISIYRLAAPALALSLVITGLTFAFNELVVPAAKYEATLTLRRALNRERPEFRENNIFYPEYGRVQQADGESANVLTRLFYAEQFDGKRMKGLTIVDRSQRNLNQILVAESALWNIQENTWDFFNGTIYLVAPDGSYRNIVKFDQQQLQLPRAPLDLAARGRDYGEMNIAQSLDYLQVIRLSGDDKKIRKLKIRIQQRFALPFACLAFGLMGAALGVRPQRTNRTTGFGISVLVVFFYYLLMSIGDALGLTGAITPWMGAWLPTGTGLGIGLFLLWRIAR